MTGSKRPPLPTDAELQILAALWRRGASTVRAVQAELGAATTGYTTVLKLLQIMLDKGLVERDESARAHVYRARDSEPEVQDRLVRRLAGRAFGGSASKLVMTALAGSRASRDELRAIRRLLDDIETSSDVTEPSPDESEEPS